MNQDGKEDRMTTTEEERFWAERPGRVQEEILWGEYAERPLDELRTMLGNWQRQEVYSAYAIKRLTDLVMDKAVHTMDTQRGEPGQ